jgi:hypothetical protein
MASTEGGAAAPCYLMDKNKLLIRAELARRRDDAAQLAAHHHERLQIGAAVDDRGFVRVARRDWQGGLQRRADRASTRERTAHVPDSRHHSQLERVRDVCLADEDTAAPHLREQLECRLCVAVLEILASQQSPVSPQQYLALSLRDPRDRLLGRIRGVRAPRSRSTLAATSSRHIGMSTRAARNPPCQFRTRPPSAHRRTGRNPQP